MPSAPGPPGLISSEPTRSRCRASRARTSARSSVRPSEGCAQSSGTLIVAQSYEMLAGLWSTLPFQMSGQGVQLAALTEPEEDGAGEGESTCPDVGEAQRALGGMQPPKTATATNARAQRTFTCRPVLRPR